MTWSDVREVPVTNVPAAAKALGDDQADAHLCASPAIAALREVHVRTPLRFISIDPSPEAMARARKVYNYSEKAALLKKGAMGWLNDDTWMLDFPWVLFVNASLPDDVGYRIVKAIWEHQDELAAIHPTLAEWKHDRMVASDIGVPYHPGAVRLFKEKGAWTPAAEAAQNKPTR
jgi:TRAP transporter TAXI family solute receptor